MTEILATPATWPAILLPRSGADAGGGTTGTDGAVGSFAGLRRAIAELGPAGTIAAVVASGLRGRGGGGFPTGEKWRAAAAMDTGRRYVVANGYGADPAVSTDRTLLERAPSAVVEGAAIAAFAIGAAEAIIAVRAEATAAISALEASIAAAEAAGHLGPDAIAPGRDLTVHVRTVQGAYMLGEETVLLKALEGKRGQPEQRPPHPTERGLFGAPTVVQNVQTLAAVPWIVRHGAEAFAALGGSASPGTILVQVRGAERSAIAEIPLGTRLGEIVALGGPVTAGHRLKAVLVGGPSGGLLPADALDTLYDFDPLRLAGAHIGSGSVVAVDDRTCVVDLARVLTRFCADEACGKTIPCRIGTRRLTEIGDRVVGGRPRPTDLQLLADLSHDMVESALCDHERLTTLPYTSGMRYFRAELDDHILRSSCPAGVCHPIAVIAGAGAQ
ncbi:MAG: NADH-quinone oxidoreductase subunit L [Chloroflexi bacterium]|nr:NADH-quinone oxidoreductase subunit L [Chloroflexota bacterium]